MLSSKAHAYLLDIDASDALKMEGVVEFVCHRDLADDKNAFGITGVVDEEVFASNKVNIFCL